MEWFWSHYCSMDQRGLPEVSPMRTPSMVGLPPAVVAIAEHDVLRHEGEQYVNRLRDDDVPVVSCLFEGQMHGFATMLGVLPAADEVLEFIAREVSTLSTNP